MNNLVEHILKNLGRKQYFIFMICFKQYQMTSQLVTLIKNIWKYYFKLLPDILITLFAFGLPCGWYLVVAWGLCITIVLQAMPAGTFLSLEG